MPIINPPPAAAAVPIGALGLLATNPSAVPTGYSWAYSAEQRNFPAYTPDVKSAAFAGGLLDLLAAARLSDLNALRIAVENLRVFTENLARQHNRISLDLAAAGIISTTTP